MFLSEESADWPRYRPGGRYGQVTDPRLVTGTGTSDRGDRGTGDRTAGVIGTGHRYGGSAQDLLDHQVTRHNRGESSNDAG